MIRLLLLLAIIAASSTAASAMDIEVRADQVVMSGPVTGGECSQLSSILQQHPVRIVVLTSSHGGDAEAGYCVGALIRRYRLATVIRGSCNSSCSRMWLGGVSRTLDGANSRVGLHGNYRDGVLLQGAPARLQAWIPSYAPRVDRQLMQQWTTLGVNQQIMYFYNDRAELCDHARCQPVPGRNALNAGLATQ